LGVKLGKEYGWVWVDEKTNRESPRILANRIFLASSCSAPAYRLRRNRTPSGKMLGKNPRAGFSIVYEYQVSLPIHLFSGFSHLWREEKETIQAN